MFVLDTTSLTQCTRSTRQARVQLTISLHQYLSTRLRQQPKQPKRQVQQNNAPRASKCFFAFGKSFFVWGVGLFQNVSGFQNITAEEPTESTESQNGTKKEGSLDVLAVEVVQLLLLAFIYHASNFQISNFENFRNRLGPACSVHCVGLGSTTARTRDDGEGNMIHWSNRNSQQSFYT